MNSKLEVPKAGLPLILMHIISGQNQNGFKLETLSVNSSFLPFPFYLSVNVVDESISIYIYTNISLQFCSDFMYVFIILVVQCLTTQRIKIQCFM